jgi:two-component system, chemotaxis family, CheB/CheR fusion protein
MMPNLPIVGIGASAGGVEALERFFESMPANNGMGFVVVTHLPPNRVSMLAQIIGRSAQMPVVDARDGDTVEAGHVYVLPSDAILTIREGRLRLRHTNAVDHERAPIDIFFTSLAQDQSEHAIGIVLSGGGSDGTLGLKAIKENGGLTVAQGANVSRPRFAQMPLSAVAAGFVDLVLPVEDIPDRIIAYVAIGALLTRNNRKTRYPRSIACCRREPGTISANTKTARFSAACSAECRWFKPRSSKNMSKGWRRTRTRSGLCCATY